MGVFLSVRYPCTQYEEARDTDSVSVLRFTNNCQNTRFAAESSDSLLLLGPSRDGPASCKRRSHLCSENEGGSFRLSKECPSKGKDVHQKDPFDGHPFKRSNLQDKTPPDPKAISDKKVKIESEPFHHGRVHQKDPFHNNSLENFASTKFSTRVKTRVRMRLPRIWYLVFFQVFGIWYFSPGEDSG